MKKGFWATVEDVINRSDIVVLVMDARFPEESFNQDIEKMVREKGRRIIYALNKCDLIKSKPYVPKGLEPHVFLSGKKGYGITHLKILLKQNSPKNTEKPRVGIVGYPNVGKSSVINRLKGYGILRTSSQPGFTKGQQYVNTPGFLLVDTPGVIPRTEIGDSKHLKMVSTLMDNRDPEEAAEALMGMYPGLIESYFAVEMDEDKELTLEAIAKKKNWIMKGNKPDTTRTAKTILQLWQDAKITPR
jgi:ribosome biogenesis GTPase A